MNDRSHPPRVGPGHRAANAAGPCMVRAVQCVTAIIFEMYCLRCRIFCDVIDEDRCPCGDVAQFGEVNSSPSDNRIHWALRKASQRGTTYFTINQLAEAAWLNVRLWEPLAGFGSAIFAGWLVWAERPDKQHEPLFGLFDHTLMFFWIPFVMCCAAAVVMAVWAFRVSLLRPLSKREFVAGVRSFEQRHGQIPKLLRGNRPLLDASREQVAVSKPQRLLICQREILVDLLILNEWHRESDTLVISESGYPTAALREVESCFSVSSDDVAVHALHDLNENGTSMRSRVESLPWLSSLRRPINDIGLSQDAIERFRNINFHVENDGAIPVDYVPWKRLRSLLDKCVERCISMTEAMPAPYRSIDNRD